MPDPADMVPKPPIPAPHFFDIPKKPFDSGNFPGPKIDPIPAPPVFNTGYVADYTLELHPPNEQFAPFFRFTLVDGDPTSGDGAGAREEFVLFRNVTVLIDKLGSNYLTVTYGNVQQAIVATVKDALLHGKKVTVTWAQMTQEFGGVDAKVIKTLSLTR